MGSVTRMQRADPKSWGGDAGIQDMGEDTDTHMRPAEAQRRIRAKAAGTCAAEGVRDRRDGEKEQVISYLPLC